MQLVTPEFASRFIVFHSVCNLEIRKRSESTGGSCSASPNGSPVTHVEKLQLKITEIIRLNTQTSTL